MKTLGVKDSSYVLNKCRQLILSYQMERRELQRNGRYERKNLINLQNKFVITLSGVMLILIDSDKEKLIETLDAFGLNTEIKLITARLNMLLRTKCKSIEINNSNNLREEADKLLNSALNKGRIQQEKKYKTFA